MRDAQKRRLIDKIRTSAALGDAATAAENNDAYEKEVSSRRSVANYEAAASALEDGDYWVFEGGGQDSRVAWKSIPEDWEKIMMHTHTSGGDPRTLVFPLYPAKHTAIQKVNDEFSQFGRYRMATEIEQFNSMPLPKRKALIQKHLAAADRLDALNSAAGEDMQGRETAMREALADMISINATIDPVTYTLIPR